VEVKEECHVTISNRFVPLEKLDGDGYVDVNWVWETIRENMKASAADRLWVTVRWNSINHVLMNNAENY